MTHKLLVDVDVDSTLIVLLHVHGGAHQQVIQVVPIQVSCTQGCTKVRPKLQQKDVSYPSCPLFQSIRHSTAPKYDPNCNRTMSVIQAVPCSNQYSLLIFQIPTFSCLVRQYLHTYLPNVSQERLTFRTGLLDTVLHLSLIQIGTEEISNKKKVIKSVPIQAAAQRCTQTGIVMHTIPVQAHSIKYCSTVQSKAETEVGENYPEYAEYAFKLGHY